MLRGLPSRGEIVAPPPPVTQASVHPPSLCGEPWPAVCAAVQALRAAVCQHTRMLSLAHSLANTPACTHSHGATADALQHPHQQAHPMVCICSYMLYTQSTEEFVPSRRPVSFVTSCHLTMPTTNDTTRPHARRRTRLLKLKLKLRRRDQTPGQMRNHALAHDGRSGRE